VVRSLLRSHRGAEGTQWGSYPAEIQEEPSICEREGPVDDKLERSQDPTYEESGHDQDRDDEQRAGDQSRHVDFGQRVQHFEDPLLIKDPFVPMVIVSVAEVFRHGAAALEHISQVLHEVLEGLAWRPFSGSLQGRVEIHAKAVYVSDEDLELRGTRP